MVKVNLSIRIQVKIHIRLTWSHDIGHLEYKGQLFANYPIKDCIGRKILYRLRNDLLVWLCRLDLSKIDPFCSVKITSMLPPLLFIFKKGIHRWVAIKPNNISHQTHFTLRAAVVDEEDRIIHVVTQSSVIQFLAKHINHFGRIATTTIEKIGLGYR